MAIFFIDILIDSETAQPMPVIFTMLFAATVTACISGIFGMAGGMVFMAVITLYLGVAEAMIVHGAVQSVSNISRAYLLRPHIRWDVFTNHFYGAVPVILLLSFLTFVPDKQLLFIVLGLLPFLLWLPRGLFQGDAEKPLHARICGALVIALNILAGVAGPALDFFYIKTAMTRQEIVATKAVTMVFSHLIKIAYYLVAVYTLLQTSAPISLANIPPWWFFVLAVPCAFLGTLFGTRILLHLKDVNFRSYTKYLVTLIGVYYLCRAAGYFGGIA